jgi:hypothetical protein
MPDVDLRTLKTLDPEARDHPSSGWPLAIYRGDRQHRESQALLLVALWQSASDRQRRRLRALDLPFPQAITVGRTCARSLIASPEAER